MTKNFLKFLQLNIQSLEKHKDELARTLIKEKYDVAFITESWTKKEYEKLKYKVPGYFTYLDSRDDGYGGAGLIIDRNIRTCEVEIASYPKIQVIARKIVNMDIVIVSIYVAPNVFHLDLKDKLKSIFRKLAHYPKVLVGGDFNCHHTSWDPRHSDNKGTALFELINEENVILMNDGQPTFVPAELGKTPSTIDLVLVTPQLFNSTTMKVLDYGIGSRHLAIENRICLVEPRRAQTFVNKAKVHEAFKKINVSTAATFQELQNVSKKIHRNARQKDKYDPKFWWSDEVEMAWQDKRNARAAFNRNGGMRELIEFKKAEAIFNKKKKEASKQRFEEFVSSFDPRTPSKEVWQKLRCLNGRKKKVNNVIVHDDPPMARVFLDKHFPQEDYLDYRPCYLPTYDIITPSFWETTLASKKSSSPGPDGISYSLLRSLSPEVRNSIIRDMNHMWRTCSLAEEIRTIKIVAIPKAGKNPETVEGTRPISLINCGLKMLNAAVLDKLQYHLEKQAFLPDLSFGFRKRMSTVSCLEFVTNKIMQIRRMNHIAAVVFIDLSNAFNAVKVEVLEQTLLSSGIPPEFSSWMIAFLVNRPVHLRVGNDTMIRYVSQGLPQGDVLSPTMFNIYTAALHSIEVEGVVLVQYADDFAMIIEGRSIEEVEARGQRFMNIFVEKARDLNFTVNAQKTKAIIFNSSPKDLNISIENNKIETVRMHMYLGLLLDKNLRYGPHIRELTHRLTDRLNMVKVISGLKHGSHPETLGLVYNALFRGFLEYGASIYGSASPTNLDKLEKINNACLRRITGCTKTTPLNTLQAISAQHPLRFRRIKVIGRQVVKHCYERTPVWEQLTRLNTFEENKMSMVERNYRQHENILKDMSYLVEIECQLGDVFVRTALDRDLWPKKTTNIKILKQLTLSLINGTYNNRQIIYTDASDNGENCGIGIYHESRNVRISLRLQHSVCIMSAEIEAIYVALQYITRSNITSPVIMTDSKSGCELIRSNIAKRERDRVIDNILEMATKSGTTIQWIPGHTGVKGNDMADQLAKAGTTSDNICKNKLLIHDGLNYFASVSEQEAQLWYLNYTAELGKGRKFFQVCNTIPKKPWHHKLPLNNIEVRTLNRLLAGHDYSNYWLSKMKIKDDCICDICDVVDNSEHVIFYCVKYALTRQKYNLDQYCNIHQLYEKKDLTLLKNVTNFLREIKSTI